MAASTDPLALISTSADLPEEERTMQEMVRARVAREIRPQIGTWFLEGKLPLRDIARSFGEMGLLGMQLTGYECAGSSALGYGLACIELEAVDSGLRSFVSVQGSLAMTAIHSFGSEEQKQRWLPSMARGETIGSFGLTEPDFGSNPAGMRTAARNEGGDWILNGAKAWITNASVSDVVIVWARTPDGVRGFIVPSDTPGFEARALENKLSLRASVTGEISLTDVRLPADAMLPLVEGLSAPLSCLNEARFGIIFGSVGAARDCLETVLRYTCEREVFGKMLSAHQITQVKLADMLVELTKAYLLALRIAELKDSGELAPHHISLGKLNNVREALAIARQCRTLLGAAGVTNDFSPLRHANNLESVLTYEGTTEVHQLILGQKLTGHTAFR